MGERRATPDALSADGTVSCSTCHDPRQAFTDGRPVSIGTSRKSFLGRLTGRTVGDRVAGTIATNVLAYERGARVFRVHDVAPVRDALVVTAATVRGAWASTTPTSSTISTT